VRTISLLSSFLPLSLQEFNKLGRQKVSKRVLLLSVAVSAKEAQIVDGCGTTLSEWNDMIELYLVVRNRLEASLTNLAVSPNHL
jgi:hypothetical protein